MSFQTNDRCITIMIVATPNRCRSYTFINNIHVMMYIYACCMLIKIGGVNRQLQLQGQTDKLIMSPHSQNHTVVFTIISNLPNSLQILKTFQPAETVKGCILHLPWFWTSTIPAEVYKLPSPGALLPFSNDPTWPWPFNTASPLGQPSKDCAVLRTVTVATTTKR